MSVLDYDVETTMPDADFLYFFKELGATKDFRISKANFLKEVIARVLTLETEAVRLIGNQDVAGLKTFLDNLTLGNSSGTETLTLDCGGASAGTISIKSGGFLRWNMQRNSTSGDYNFDKYNAGGVFENRPLSLDSASDSITMDIENLILENGAADGTNLVLRSSASGTDWIIDHSSGSLRFIYGGIKQNIDSSGNALFNANMTIVGSLSKGSGSFKIEHPLEEKADTNYLVHSFVESPQADNIYSGMITLKNGYGEVNIDNYYGMTTGTFEALNRKFRRTSNNESGYTPVKCKLEGAVLKIFAKDEKCNDEISWEVKGERQDKHMYDTEWTNAEGEVIVEPERTETRQEEADRFLAEEKYATEISRKVTEAKERKMKDIKHLKAQNKKDLAEMVKIKKGGKK